MTSQDPPWSLGFLVDAHGKIYKRVKLGNDTYFKLRPGYQWVPLSKRSGPIEDALNRAKIFPNRLAGVFKSRSTDPRQTMSADSSDVRGRKRIRDSPEGERSKSPKRARQSHELPDPLPNRSPSPSGDLRVPLWQNETRAFKGTTELFEKAEAEKLAVSAEEAKLWVDGKPQFNIFVAGSYKPYVKTTKKRENKLPEHRSWGRGGYAVVLRDPYFNEENAQSVDNIKRKSQQVFFFRRKNKPHNFNDIHAWNSCRVLSSDQTELAAIAQALHIALTSVKQHKPPSGAYVCVLTVSKVIIQRLQNKRAMAFDEPVQTLGDALTMPLMRAVIWLSHCLANEGCEVKVQWLPSRCVSGHKLAASAANSSSNKPVFHQRDLPAAQRDGIMDAVHGDLMEIVGRINVGTQPLLPPQCESKKKEGGDDGDMLDKVSGSAVHKEIGKK